MAAALRYARAGVRSQREVLERLRRDGCAHGVVERALAECRRQGLVDDRACARLWAEHWARQGLAWAAIRLKLSAKGLGDRAVEEAAVSVGATPADDEARANAVVARRLRVATVRLSRSHLARVLASRGFDSDVIERILAASCGVVSSDAER